MRGWVRWGWRVSLEASHEFIVAVKLETHVRDDEGALDDRVRSWQQQQPQRPLKRRELPAKAAKPHEANADVAVKRVLVRVGNVAVDEEPAGQPARKNLQRDHQLQARLPARALVRVGKRQLE